MLQLPGRSPRRYANLLAVIVNGPRPTPPAMIDVTVDNYIDNYWQDVPLTGRIAFEVRRTFPRAGEHTLRFVGRS